MTGSGGAGGACAAELVTTEPVANTAPTTSMARETLRIVISSRVDWGILLPLPGKDEHESAAARWARQARPRASLTSVGFAPAQGGPVILRERTVWPRGTRGHIHAE